MEEETKGHTQQRGEDNWDLSSLFKSNEEWQDMLEEVRKDFSAFKEYKGRLQEEEVLLKALRSYESANMKAEAVSEYASLLYYADCTNAAAQSMRGKALMMCVEAGEAASFFEPEIQAIESNLLKEWMTREEYAPYRVYLRRLMRMKKHTLSEKEERLLSLQGEASGTASTAFGALTNADMDAGSVNVEGKDKPLTQSTWSSFMEMRERAIREEAYKKFYTAFNSHKETLAALYAGQVAQDVFITKARGYKSCLERALYYDNVDESVYRGLIKTIRKNIPTLHRYYALMKRALGVEDLCHYDVYAPLTKDVSKDKKVPYTEAVDMCCKALSPLGEEYTAVLREGLLGGWVDRYERRGKRSGAFSAGSYKREPFILLNYQDDTLRDVFTIAHEGGHSMHSLYSAASNPYMQWNYSIFEAEVASTLNEELLFQYLLKRAEEKDEKDKRNALLDRRAKDIVATLYRQTMFAEFELKTHEMVEAGEPLSCEVLRREYRALLSAYFGKDMHFEEESSLECFRIPHFYNAFYVYKYATGMSAALSIAHRIETLGESARDDYMKFLHSGGSRWPIDALKVAGVDMSGTEAVQDACNAFAKIVDELEKSV